MRTNKRNMMPMQQLAIIYEGKDGDISLSPMSVDKQIDSLLIAFQDDSSETDDDAAIVPEGVTSMYTALLLLEEAEEDSPEKQVTDDSKGRSKDPGAAMIPKLNIDDFASKVAALIDTAHKRLDVETVILNRARNFIADEYGDQVGDQLVELLSSTYGVDVATDDEDDPNGDHYAAGSNGPSL